MTSFYRNTHTHTQIRRYSNNKNKPTIGPKKPRKTREKKVHAERNNGKSCNYLCKSLVDIFVQISSFLAFFYFICDACSA